MAEVFRIRIEKLVYGGDGLGRHEGQVVFVPFTAAGDQVDVWALTRKKNFVRARIVEVVEPGPGRTDPPCPYFFRCGGCQWQHLDYGLQAETKRRILEELFRHRFPETRALEIGMLPSPAPYHYRSRARLQLRRKGGHASVGFFRFQSHQIEDIESCPQLRPTLNRALAAVRRAWFERKEESAELEIACSEEDGAWSARTTGPPRPDGFPVEAGDGRAAGDLLERTVGDFDYLLSPSAFFQANDFLVADLVRTVMDFAGPGKESAIDLFSGAGLFSLPLARRFPNVTAVEGSPEACRLAEESARKAGLDRIRVVCGDVSAWMEDVASAAAPAFDVVVLDPPRTGAGREVMSALSLWGPERIVYVSCDPQTLARDLGFLPSGEYRIHSVRALDLFPQTYHFETVVGLSRI